MKLLFCHDTYYTTTPDNDVVSYGAFPYSLWATRFLTRFDKLTVIGRKQEYDPLIDDNLELSSGPNTDFCLLDNFNTPIKRIFASGKQKSAIEEQVKQCDAVVIRGPVEFGMLAAKYARKHNKPYAVEMSGCAFDHTWYHGSKIGKVYAPIKYVRARHMVKNASAVTYVTKHFLQNRYPANSSALKAYASNVEIKMPEQTVLENRKKRIEQTGSRTINIGMIGHITNYLKGLPIAIKALALIKEEVPDFKLMILGQGDPQKWQHLIQENNLEKNIEFCGTLPGGSEVLNWLDNIDIYIQPSFHEGLPRALIEAMSRACPALASTAGGTDELLQKEFIHCKGDHQTLAKQIKNLMAREIQHDQASLNFQKAKEYTVENLQPRRDEFWNNFAELVKQSL